MGEPGAGTGDAGLTAVVRDVLDRLGLADPLTLAEVALLHQGSSAMGGLGTCGWRRVGRGAACGVAAAWTGSADAVGARGYRRGAGRADVPGGCGAVAFGSGLIRGPVLLPPRQFWLLAGPGRLRLRAGVRGRACRVLAGGGDGRVGVVREGGRHVDVRRRIALDAAWWRQRRGADAGEAGDRGVAFDGVQLQGGAGSVGEQERVFGQVLQGGQARRRTRRLAAWLPSRSSWCRRPGRRRWTSSWRCWCRWCGCGRLRCCRR